jgi:hypothetical protein
MSDPIDLTQLGLSDQELSVLKRALGGSDEADFVRKLRDFRESALAEYVNWLVGRTRFTSLAELDTYRILHLFLDIRVEVPTVESLVDEIGLSVGRATSLLSRLRYGEARALRALVLRQSLAEITKKLGGATEESHRKAIWVKPEVFDVVFETAITIMLAPEEQGPGKKWVRAEMPEGTRSRYGQPITATMEMWKYIMDLIQATLHETSPAI